MIRHVLTAMSQGNSKNKNGDSYEDDDDSALFLQANSRVDLLKNRHQRIVVPDEPQQSTTKIPVKEKKIAFKVFIDSEWGI